MGHLNAAIVSGAWAEVSQSGVGGFLTTFCFGGSSSGNESGLNNNWELY